MISWLLVVWLCAGPGACHWELWAQHHNEWDCQDEARIWSTFRYATCVPVAVPTPGTPTG